MELKISAIYLVGPIVPSVTNRTYTAKEAKISHVDDFGGGYILECKGWGVDPNEVGRFFIHHSQVASVRLELSDVIAPVTPIKKSTEAPKPMAGKRRPVSKSPSNSRRRKQR